MSSTRQPDARDGRKPLTGRLSLLSTVLPPLLQSHEPDDPRREKGERGRLRQEDHPRRATFEPAIVVVRLAHDQVGATIAIQITQHRNLSAQLVPVVECATKAAFRRS